MRRTQCPSRVPRLTSHLLTAALAMGALLAPVDAIARQRSEPAPHAAPATPDPLIVIVSLRKQRLTVFNKDGIVTDSPVSSGQPEFPTPTGIFSVIGKEVEHESNIYEGASMPYMQRLTWTGTAMHAGNLPGYAASHGCVRLPYNFSQRLFGMTQINTRVIVTRDDVQPQPISHPNLFVPPVQPDAPASDQPLATAVTSKVASLAGMTPAMAAPAPVTGSNVLPLTAKAKARFADTARLNDAIKPAEAARATVWDGVKAANRGLEAAKADINGQQNAIDDAQRMIEKTKRAKVAAEAQLANIMRKAENARTPEAIEAAGLAEDAAEARLLDLVAKHDAAIEAASVLKSGLPALTEKLRAAEAARRSLDDDLKKTNQALKDAQSAHALAKREDVRYMKPVSVLVSRKDKRLYVRQGFDPVLEVPIVIDKPDVPLGTHVFTAMGVKGGRALHWSVVSLNLPSSAKGRAELRQGLTAAAALDRIQFPAEALEAIADVVKPGSSLIVSDEGTSQYFGNGTDFTVSVR